MSSHGLTRENLLKTLPAALRADKSVVALADAAAQILAQRPAEIDRLRVYPDIFRLDETMLDILAYDFKVDWWDGDYTLEEKRRTLRDNWNVHRTLGTKYAVETALGDIFPGAWTEEWFEYGGTPYCFRIMMPIPELGITAEKQRRVLSRVWYYKNLRSHLESFEFHWKDSCDLRLGAYTVAGEVVEIWPELTTNLEVCGQIGAAGLTAETHMMEVYPELPVKVDLTQKVGIGGLAAQKQNIEVYPELPTRVEATGITMISGLTAAGQTTEVYPELPVKVETTGIAITGGATASGAVVEIYPGLTDGLEFTAKAGTDSIIAAQEIVEIYPDTERIDES